MPGMKMKMSDKPDANDVAYDAYLANDRTLNDPEVVKVEKGGVVRLRIINGGSGTNFFIDLGNLEGELIATDGLAVQPLKGKRFPVDRPTYRRENSLAARRRRLPHPGAP